MPSHTAVGLLNVLGWRRTILESLYRSSNDSPHTMPTPHPHKHSRNAIQSIFLWVLQLALTMRTCFLETKLGAWKVVVDWNPLRSWAQQVPNELATLDKEEGLMSNLSSQIGGREKVASSRIFGPPWWFSKGPLLLTSLASETDVSKQG